MPCVSSWPELRLLLVMIRILRVHSVNDVTVTVPVRKTWRPRVMLARPGVAFRALATARTRRLRVC